MKIERQGSATWTGGLKDGRGTISTQSGALAKHPYGYAARFEGVAGTNPEELIGAAHAGCFTMALSLMLGEAGLTAERLETQARVRFERQEQGFAITAVHLKLEARVPGVDEVRFREIAERAKAGCPVSKVLKAEITLDAKLAG
jgi:osmotically inducible protein OsmC